MIEICCGSVRDALLCDQMGIRRIELNSALSLGGLTPSVAALEMIKASTNLEVICMVRPRGGGFCYDEADYCQMYREAESLLAHGADGLAFGFLTPERMIDEVRVKAFVDLIHKTGHTAVFHRAFDCVDDQEKALETLIACGVDRVLSSGGAETALEGFDILLRLKAIYGDRIEILPGAGIRPENVKSLLEAKFKNIHATCKGYVADPTTTGRVSFQIYQGALKDMYERVDEMTLAAMIKACEHYW